MEKLLVHNLESEIMDKIKDMINKAVEQATMYFTFGGYKITITIEK